MFPLVKDMQGPQHNGVFIRRDRAKTVKNNESHLINSMNGVKVSNTKKEKKRWMFIERLNDTANI